MYLKLQILSLAVSTIPSTWLQILSFAVSTIPSHPHDSTSYSPPEHQPITNKFRGLHFAVRVSLVEFNTIAFVPVTLISIVRLSLAHTVPKQICLVNIACLDGKILRFQTIVVVESTGWCIIGSAIAIAVPEQRWKRNLAIRIQIESWTVAPIIGKFFHIVLNCAPSITKISVWIIAIISLREWWHLIPIHVHT